MHRKLTSRVLFEKIKKYNKHEYNFSNWSKNNPHYFSPEIEILSQQTIYNPENFEPTRVLLIGMMVKSDLFYTTERKTHRSLACGM